MSDSNETPVSNIRSFKNQPIDSEAMVRDENRALWNVIFSIFFSWPTLEAIYQKHIAEGDKIPAAYLITLMHIAHEATELYKQGRVEM